MNILPDGRAPRVLWLMLIVAAGWVLYSFGLHYESCREGGTGQVGCFVVALVLSWLKVVFFVILTIIKLITLVMP